MSIFFPFGRWTGKPASNQATLKLKLLEVRHRVFDGEGEIVDARDDTGRLSQVPVLSVRINCNPMHHSGDHRAASADFKAWPVICWGTPPVTARCWLLVASPQTVNDAITSLASLWVNQASLGVRQASLGVRA